MNTERIYMKEFNYLEFDALYRDYAKKHNQIIGDLLNPKLKKKKLPKVVVVQPDMRTGYGNRLAGIVCGFLYSIVSDRLFFIEGYKHFDEFFLLDFDHDWNVIKKFYFKNTSRYLHDVHKVNDFKLITNGNFKDVESFDILYVHTWDYVCAPLMSNPHYKDWIGKLIPDYRIFTAISLKLFRLKLDFVDQVKNFIDNNFAEHNIGVHIRTKKALHNLEIPIEHYFNVVRMLLMGIEGKNISVFIASDTNESREKLANLLDSTKYINKNTVNIVYVENDMRIYNPWTLNPGTEANALIDMKILSFCDDLVITYGSSFGFIAAGWSYTAITRQRGPFILMPVQKSPPNSFLTEDKVLVWGAGSSEPCMYLSKLLIRQEDKEIVDIFKKNPLWMHYSQCHWPT
ncbi:13495_t:CDS:1 [Cetraspora pellucida]|uniref:13495_t:CDS:1 n=1 Tax=Cetraspora pellucida TaxID=1433469 RepID=A0A9N9F8J9_9GLOM|nr:13495_t:CDS:1 [Cetraspora pellucida]